MEGISERKRGNEPQPSRPKRGRSDSDNETGICNGTSENPCPNINCPDCKRFEEVGVESKGMVAVEYEEVVSTDDDGGAVGGGGGLLMANFFAKHVFPTLETSYKKDGHVGIDFKAALAPCRELLAEFIEMDIKKTKKSPWCKVCQERAIYYCCNGVHYCSEKCQYEHWAVDHKLVCDKNKPNRMAMNGKGDQSNKL